MEQAPIIKDDRLSPYFIKLVNSSYEIHQTHTPKNGGKEYTKLVCTNDTIRRAVMSIVKRKMSLNRKTKKVIALQEYLDEFKRMKDVVETLLDDDSPERQIRKLTVRIVKLENVINSLKVKDEVSINHGTIPILKF